MKKKIITFKMTVNEDETLTIESSLGDKHTSKQLTAILRFLSMDIYSKNEEFIRVVWDVDEFIAPIIRLMTKEEMIKLVDTLKIFIRPYTLFYIPDKTFNVKWIANSTKHQYYGLCQYFPDIEDEPEDLAPYVTSLIEALDIMKMEPNRLTSPVTIYEDTHRELLESLPAKDMPMEAARYAWFCSSKLWIEAYRLGYFPQTWDLDIKECFTTIASKMIDTRKIMWTTNKAVMRKAEYGYCRGYVTINKECTIHPIIYINEDNELSTPTGSWETYLTQAEINFIYKWKIGSFELIDGWWGIPAEKKYPLYAPIQELLALKAHENPVVSRIAKRMANAVFYGKFGEQRKKGFGPQFNSCWFAEISSQARLEVADFIYRNRLVKNVIHVSVDGVLLDKPPVGKFK